MSLKSSYYLTAILSIHRGWNKGKFSNAKPLYFLSIIKCIEDGVILGNRFIYNAQIENAYLDTCALYEPNVKPAPFYKPFYHSIKESYYDIKWINGKLPEHKWHTPSAKFLRENVEYAYLDDGLWELLQDKEIRDEYRKAIISHFLTSEQ